MIKKVGLNYQALTFILRTIFVAAIIFTSSSHISAQSQTCGVGTRVVFEDGRNGVGTILEIGTENPHVGWYRIGFTWQPKGEWFPPYTKGLLIEGTKTRCTQAATSGKQPSKTTPQSSSSQNTQTVLPEINGCPFEVPPGKVSNTSPASAQLFKRVIYNRAAAKINPESISAPKRVGLTFLKFQMEAPYKNTLTSSRFGDKRRHDGAPVGAMIYPLKTTELLCELHGEQIRRTVTEETHSCFKNRDGEWTCPGRIIKFVETKLIPVK